jgi:protein TonB
MGKPEWSRYVRLSLVIHLVLLSAGGALLYAHRSLPDKGAEPIRVHLAEPGPVGGNQGVPGEPAGGGTPASRESGETAREALLEQLLEAPSQVSDQGEVQAPAGSSGETADSTLSGSGSSQGSGGEVPGTGTTGGSGNGEGASEGGTGTSGGGGEGEEAGDRSRDASLTGYSKIYPQASRASGEEGTALVGVAVSAGGEVTSAWLEGSSGYDRLDRAALKSAWQWSFSPALDASGRPVPARKTVHVVYSLNE